MTEGTANLKPVVKSCLDDIPKKRPPVEQVSMTIKRVKDVCSQKSGHDGMSPIEWWTEVHNKQQSQVTSSLTNALEEMTISNKQLRREVDVLKTENNMVKVDNTQLRANIDAMKDEITQLKAKQKDEIGQLTTLLNKMAVNNENQIQQINSQSSEIDTMRDEIGQLRTEVDMIKAENVQLKIENDDFKGCVGTSKLHYFEPPTGSRHKSKQQLVLKESTTPGDLFSGPVNIKWEEGPPAPVGRAYHTAVWLNGLVYVGGGIDTAVVSSYTINCYDPVENSWNSPITTPYCLFAMTKLNNKLLIAGGRDKSDKVTKQILTMEDGQLKNYTKMTIARLTATASGHQGMLIITGGMDDKAKVLSFTDLFDSTNGQWYTCSDLPQPHNWLQSVIVDNILYLLGGLSKDGNYSTAVFTAPLDNLSNHQLKWNTHQDTPWCRPTPVRVNGTQLLIVGGMKGYIYNSDVHKLNKISHTWEAIGHIPAARYLSAAVSTADNRIIVIGGYNDEGKQTNTVWIGSCEPQ